MYSAFLIMNVTDGLKSIGKDRCEKTYSNFLKLHNVEIERVRENKNLSSMGI